MSAVFEYRINFLGCPSNPDVPWTTDNLKKLCELGFNTVQLNIAWGARPADEPLNLEDVVDVAGSPAEGWQSLPLASVQTPQRIEGRRAGLKKRIALCKEMGLRTIFHFGAPYNMHCKFGDNPPNCLLDESVIGFYQTLLELFNEQFPGVDDILLYTYDQDAWLCSEFGDCPRCMGVPLHERVGAFVNRLAQTWQRLNSNGKLWWEPWELSAGQVLSTIDELDSSCTGLMLHSNIAEVMASMPVDRWLKNAVMLARKANLPVVVEHFLGAPTEEVEPLQHLCWPLVTWRALKSIAALEVDGIKEYYGSVPGIEDPNLRMAAIFFSDPCLSEEEALQRLAVPYGSCADKIILLWRAAGEAMELFPWDTSWWIREIGKCNPVHSMTAAFLRGQQAHTPSWESTRRAIFMKTDDDSPDAWMLEDVQLRCTLAAERLEEAIQVGKGLIDDLSAPLAAKMELTLADLSTWKICALSYAYHIRETNLTRILRKEWETGHVLPERIVSELKGLLQADIRNQGHAEPCQSALRLLESDPEQFVQQYFCEDTSGKISEEGRFTVTSR